MAENNIVKIPPEFARITNENCESLIKNTKKYFSENLKLELWMRN